MTQEGDMLVVFGLDGDQSLPVVAVTTPGTDVSQHVIALVGVDNPYYVFNSIPFDYSNGISVDFTGAPTCSANATINNNNIIGMLETPPLDKVSAP